MAYFDYSRVHSKTTEVVDQYKKGGKLGEYSSGGHFGIHLRSQQLHQETVDILL
jgi:hypothetical protein